MTTTLLLRIASAIALVFAAGHSLGGLRDWSPMGANNVLEAMSTVRFAISGVERTYLDFYRGFGWCLSVALLLESILLWQIASLARCDAVQLRPVILAFVLATFAMGVLAWRLILPVAAVFCGALLIPLIAAYWCTT